MVAVAGGMRPTATHQEKNAMPNTVHRRKNNLAGFIAALAALLPLAGATRLREPFAWLLWVPAAVILLILLYQYLASVGTGQNLPVLRLLVVSSGSSGSWIVALEAAFAAYLLAFSVRTGRGI